MSDMSVAPAVTLPTHAPHTPPRQLKAKPNRAVGQYCSRAEGKQSCCRFRPLPAELRAAPAGED
jgi:hypothetical protein